MSTPRTPQKSPQEKRELFELYRLQSDFTSPVPVDIKLKVNGLIKKVEALTDLRANPMRGGLIMAELDDHAHGQRLRCPSGVLL